MCDDFHPISPAGEPFDGDWKLDDDTAIPFFSLSFSRDEDDLLTALVDQQDAQGPEGLSPFKVESTTLPRYSFDECDDDSFVSPDIHASLSAEPEQVTSSLTPAAASETANHQSRKRKIVTPQQRRRQVASSLDMELQHCYSSTIRRVSSDSYHTASRMLSCMQRSEDTRAQILDNFPWQEDHPVAKKRRSVQDCFLHTQISRERLLSWLG